MLLLAALSFGTVISACSDDKDDNDIETIVSVNQLPSNAKSFLNNYFKDVKATKVTLENDGGIVVYDVDLANGFEVVFNASGEWVEVDAPDGMTIPDGIAMEEIVTYIEANYSGYGINEISKVVAGYDVELTSGVELLFDYTGNFIKVIDMN